MAEGHGRPVLTYDRVAENRRRTRRALALLPIAVLPSILFFGEYLMVCLALPLALLLGAFVESESDIALFFVADALVAIATLGAAFMLMYITASQRVLRSIRAKPLRPSEEREFEQVVENMAIASGLPLPSLFMLETDAANLVAIGLSPRSSSLIASRGLLRLLDRVELEAAVAHAMSQIGNEDTRLVTVLAAATDWLRLPGRLVRAVFGGLVALASRAGVAGWGCLIALALWLGLPLLLGLQWALADADLRPWLLLLLLATWYVFFGAPLAVLLISRFTSRERKHLADADAILLTRNPGGLARALAKIDQVGAVYSQATGETSPLHFADPLPPDAGWLDRAFDTHPPIRARLDVVRRLGGTVSDAELQRAAEEARLLAAAHIEEEGTGPTRDEPLPGSPIEAPSTEVEAIELQGNGTPLLSGPDARAAQVAWLDRGTRLVVTADQGDYLQVITPADQFGFISRDAPFDALKFDDWLGPRWPSQ